MYKTHNKENFVVAERFIRILENKIYKYFTSVRKNVYINKLDDIVDEHNHTYHRTTKMKPVNVKPCSYIEFGVESRDINPKFEIGNYVRILKKGRLRMGQTEFLWLKVVKSLHRGYIYGRP